MNDRKKKPDSYQLVFIGRKRALRVPLSDRFQDPTLASPHEREILSLKPVKKPLFGARHHHLR